MLTYVVFVVIAIPLVLLVVDVASPKRKARPAAHVRPALNPEARSRSGHARANYVPGAAPAPAGTALTQAFATEPAADASAPARPRIAPGDGMVYRGPLRQG